MLTAPSSLRAARSVQLQKQQHQHQHQQQHQQHQQRRPQLCCRASAAAAADADAAPSRRAALAAAAAAVLLAAGLAPSSARAAPSGPVLCVESESADLAADCRRAALAADKPLSYRQQSARSADSERPAANVPVAKLDSAYARETQALSASISSYVAVPSADARARAPMVKPLRAECQQWASKYARGGSARSQSARAMYVAVDAVMGHLASNGIAPLPGAKLREVGASLEASATYLAEGR